MSWSIDQVRQKFPVLAVFVVSGQHSRTLSLAVKTVNLHLGKLNESIPAVCWILTRKISINMYIVAKTWWSVFAAFW